MKKLNKNLENLKKILKNSKAMSLDEITKALNWSPKFKKENREILNSWVENGELIKNKKNKYNLPENLGFIRGTFSIIKGKFAFVDTDKESYFIPRSNFGTALDGDTVLIEITSINDFGKKEGSVVKVISREKNIVIGIFERKENFGFVRPQQSFGKDIYIPRNFFGKAKDGDLVSVEITFWGNEEKKPEGKITKVIGTPYDSNNMIEALMIREGVSEIFPDEAIAEARKLNITIDEKEIKNRKDLRNLPIITIDGDDAKDLDDAVYVEKTEKGFYKLFVSIADVSHYIKPGSALDKEAEKRGNSIYLVDRVLPMFPKEISNGICSLNPNEDKLTFTVELLIDNLGRTLDVQTYKSIIKTAHRMTYTNVNKILNNNPEMTEKYGDIKDMVFTMLELSKIIREIKYNRGSIDFNLPEVKVVLDENKKVKYLKNINRGESEKIIEDFMIAANEAVAEKLFWLEIPSVYRVHETPDSERVKTLSETLSRFGYKIQSFEDIHPKKFQAIIEDSEKKGINMIVHKMILMSLKQAKYSMENLGHFGLASSYYTHFTSPIRRYADLLVHRILDLSSKGYPTKKQFGMLLKYLPEITEHISKTERKAMKIEDESIKIKVVEYMMDKIGDEFKATIIGFNNKKIFFETEEHIECFWDITTAKNFYDFNETTYTMNDLDSGRVFSLGDKMDITIVRADLQMLEIEVVPNEFMSEYRSSRTRRSL